MLFRKIGSIFPKEAQLPTLIDRNDQIRVYYSNRINNQSFINYFEVHKKNLKISYINKKPVLCPGKRGCFDDVGVMPSCFDDENNELMYYTGWSLRENVPYVQAIGSAIFNENKNKFERLSIGPILDRSDKVPYLCNSAFIKNKKMFFCNGTGWKNNFPTYNIWFAKKNSNQNWIVYDHVLGSKKEACSRPCIMKNCFILSKKTKNSSYEIFTYENGRFNKAIPRSRNISDWDYEMTCYPYFFDEKYVFYNGNGYGKSGVGVAELL